ncbi:MarR family winged helix-turn-helix transcriptional regulator [Pseudonocardia kunmingensis]|uniref:DNA-binding MarR family transcriptional regulator n=1 Tax=Pseudonocardia kunmingensis TaxID=630975 RepID=A0A543DPF0_9PSEU|nr:MarR family transcriptional regulator [Pseudonocardia kunmingensis]TQM11207.1 DNA-binding MarR family transcriptional regulator [Pseudonocardia kunmingensis]
MAPAEPGPATRSEAARTAADLTVVSGCLARRLRAESSVPPHHLAVMARLRDHGAETTSGLAARERVRPQSMAQTVADLVSEGFVVRRDDPDDGRKLLLDLTDRGRVALEHARLARTSWLTTGIEQQLDDAERAVLEHAIVLLNRLLDR